MNTPTLTNTKRSYHPLVIFFYYAKLLSAEQLDQIPKTTIDYWKLTPHADMFGYEWVSSFYDNYEDFNSIQKHKIIFKSARLCCKLFTAFSDFSKDIKSYTKIFKNNVATVIQTIDYLAKEIPLNKACSVFNISTQKFYRLKNKLYCSASVLNHCFKTHPQQLTIAECSAIKEAINDSDNERKKLATIWYKLLREGRLFCSRSTFYKYANLVSERIKKLNYEKRNILFHPAEFLNTFILTLHYCQHYTMELLGRLLSKIIFQRKSYIMELLIVAVLRGLLNF
ncbi:MAG TPA: hypothetical protein VNG53_06310 [Bacteroidia bacterium]|nr:hypothetical protein [Bacteroidia bacterium]